jgi:ABC-type phosphate/phosphonate transport system permease subunit
LEKILKTATIIQIRDTFLRITALVLATADFINLLFALFGVPPPHALLRLFKTTHWPSVLGTLLCMIMAIFSIIALLLYLNSFLRKKPWWVSLIVILVTAAIPPIDWFGIFDWITSPFSSSPTPHTSTNTALTNVIFG